MKKVRNGSAEKVRNWIRVFKHRGKEMKYVDPCEQSNTDGRGRQGANLKKRKR